MSLALLLPTSMLVMVFSTCLYLLHEDGRQRRLDRQIRMATWGRGGATEGERPLGIRRRSPADDEQRRGWLDLLFHYDPEAPLSWPASRTVMAGAAAAIVMMLAASFVVPLWLAMLEGAMTGPFVIRALFKWQRERYAGKLARQIPDTVSIVVSAVRAGLPIGEAFKILGREMPDPTREQFARANDELALGREPADALLDIHRRTGVTEYAIFSVAVSVQARSGGRLAETLQTMGDTMRDRIALAGRARALAAEAKLSARVLAALPFLAGTALSFERPGYLNPLVQEHSGRFLLAYGIASLLAGILTMRRMIKKGTTV